MQNLKTAESLVALYIYIYIGVKIDFGHESVEMI